MTGSFPQAHTCEVCRASYIGQDRWKCPACREKANRRRNRAPSPAREAYRLQDPELYRQALRGELD